MCQCRPADPTDQGDAADLSIMGYLQRRAPTGSRRGLVSFFGHRPDPKHARTSRRDTRCRMPARSSLPVPSIVGARTFAQALMEINRFLTNPAESLGLR